MKNISLRECIFLVLALGGMVGLKVQQYVHEKELAAECAFGKSCYEGLDHAWGQTLAKERKKSAYDIEQARAYDKAQIERLEREVDEFMKAQTMEEVRSATNSVRMDRHTPIELIR